MMTGKMLRMIGRKPDNLTIKVVLCIYNKIK